MAQYELISEYTYERRERRRYVIEADSIDEARALWEEEAEEENDGYLDDVGDGRGYTVLNDHLGPSVDEREVSLHLIAGSEAPPVPREQLPLPLPDVEPAP